MALRPSWASQGRTGPVRKFLELSVFACEGAVVLIDEREGAEGDCSIVSVADMRERIEALAAPYRNKTKAEMNTAQKRFYDQRRRGVENLIECCREAQAMGDPTDPAVQAFWARHRRGSSFAVRAPANDTAGYFRGYEALPPLPQGRDIGITAVPDGTYDLYRPSRRKTSIRSL